MDSTARYLQLTERWKDGSMTPAEAEELQNLWKAGYRDPAPTTGRGPIPGGIPSELDMVKAELDSMAGSPGLIPTSAPGIVGMPPSEPDPAPEAAGGGPVDPDAATAAAERAKEDIPSETMTVDAKRHLPNLRGFTDQTFILMHSKNLVDLRNDNNSGYSTPPGTAIEHQPDIESGEDGGIVQNTIRSLKHEMPFAYHPTDANPQNQNAVIQCYGEPATFKNYITSRPGYQRYLNASTATLSSMVPKIRLYKVFGATTAANSEPVGEQAVELVFETSGISAGELGEMIASRGTKRGYGVGIKSFDFQIVQGNPAISDSSIQATMVLFASSMEDLLKPRYGTLPSNKHLTYRFAELAFMSTGKNPLGPDLTTRGSIEDLDFRFVADVGVVATDNTLGLETDYSSMAMSIGAVGHSFDIGQDGSITLTIEFEGNINHRFRDPSYFDVFSSKTSVTLDLYQKYGRAILKDRCDAAHVQEFNQRMAAYGNSFFKKRLTHLNDLLRRKGKIYYIELRPEVLQGYNDAFNSFEKEVSSDSNEKEALKSDKVKRGFENLKKALQFYNTAPSAEDNEDEESREHHAENPGDTVWSISNSAQDEKKSQEYEKAMEGKEDEVEPIGAIRDCGINPNSTQVAYFYAGDLINVILENLSNIYEPIGMNDIIKEAMDMTDAIWPEDKDKSFGPAGMGLTALVGGTQQKANVTIMNEVTSKMKSAAADFKKYRVVLGPTMVYDFFGPDPVMCSIGDIPIALNHFNAWLATATDGKNKDRYPLDEFLDDFITEYLRSMIMGDPKQFDENSLGDLKYFDSDTILGYGSKNEEADTDPLTLHRTSIYGKKGLAYTFVPDEERPLINNKPSKFLRADKLNTYDYKVFYNAMSEFCLPRTPERMAKTGIHVFHHGRDRGIIKDIQYQKTTVPRRKEIMALAHIGSKWEGASQIAEVFDATILSYPNLEAFIGQKIFIDPASVTPYLSKETLDTFPNFKGLYNLDRFGIGGMYEINQVHHSFSEGKFETRIISIQDTKYMDDKNDEEKNAKPPPSAPPDWQHANQDDRAEIFQQGTNIPYNYEGEQITEPTASCKSPFDTGPEDIDRSKSAGASWAESAIEAVGAAIEAGIGYFKGIWDAVAGEVRGEELDPSFWNDYQARKAGEDPTQGNSAAAANGPAQPAGTDKVSQYLAMADLSRKFDAWKSSQQ